MLSSIRTLHTPHCRSVEIGRQAVAVAYHVAETVDAESRVVAVANLVAVGEDHPVACFARNSVDMHRLCHFARVVAVASCVVVVAYQLMAVMVVAWVAEAFVMDTVMRMAAVPVVAVASCPVSMEVVAVPLAAAASFDPFVPFAWASSKAQVRRQTIDVADPHATKDFGRPTIVRQPNHVVRLSNPF